MNEVVDRVSEGDSPAWRTLAGGRPGLPFLIQKIDIYISITIFQFEGKSISTLSRKSHLKSPNR